MIYTITLNPSIDYFMTVKDMEAGKINRSLAEYSHFGGKGINVSAMLLNLGVSSTVLGFAGGYTGREIERLCKRQGIKCDFTSIREDSRINIKVVSEKECAINGKGPFIYLEEEEALLSKLSEISPEDTVILSGKAPESESGNLLRNIVDAISHTRFIADMEGDALSYAIEKGAYLVKPNEHELSALFGKVSMTDEEIAAAANSLRGDGAKNVLVSLGERGALLAAEDGNIYKMRAPSVEAVDTTGAGDSLLAGFVAAVSQGQEMSFALALSVAAGSATAGKVGIADGESVLSVLSEM